MPNYAKHRMSNWDWYQEYRSRMGDEAYCRYEASVFNLLDGMKSGNFFVIEKNVQPENIELFIKICCYYIIKQQYANVSKTIHEFSDDYSSIKCK